MKMVDYFNYKVALHPNDKNTRAIYRFTKWDSVMIDLSYYEIIKISGNKEDILETLSKYLNKERQNEFRSLKLGS